MDHAKGKVHCPQWDCSAQSQLKIHQFCQWWIEQPCVKLPRWGLYPAVETISGSHPLASLLVPSLHPVPPHPSLLPQTGLPEAGTAGALPIHRVGARCSLSATPVQAVSVTDMLYNMLTTLLAKLVHVPPVLGPSSLGLKCLVILPMHTRSQFSTVFLHVKTGWHVSTML